MFWCIIMSSNSKNCLQQEEYYVHATLMIFMVILMIFIVILMIFIVMDNGNGASSPHGFYKIGGRETKV